MQQHATPQGHGIGRVYSPRQAPSSFEVKSEDGLSRSKTQHPIAQKLPDTLRNHFVAMSGEFVGTVLFLFFALAGTQVANSVNTSSGLSIAETGNNPQQLLYIAICFGFSLAVNAWTFFRISGGLFNPAVTLGLCMIGALPWVRGALLFVTQIVGGVVAAALVSCMFPGPLNVSTTLNAGTSTAQGLFIEMFLTAQLVFTIFMLAAEKHRGTFIAPVGIGLSLFIAELTGVHWTGGSLNPARSFGPCVATRSFPGTHWIYWVGPLLGAALATSLYYLFKFLDYETANPGQDVETPESAEEAKQRLAKRRDSAVTTTTMGTFWNGETAETIAGVTSLRDCEACKARAFGRPSFASPTLPNSPSRRTLGSVSIGPINEENLPAKEEQVQYAAEPQSHPSIHVINPTPPLSELELRLPGQLDFGLPRAQQSNSSGSTRNAAAEREYMDSIV